MTIEKDYVKRHGVSISLATLISWITLAPAFWFLAKPVLTNAVSEAVADDIKTQVKSEVKPLINAYKVILESQINQLRVEIRLLELKRKRSDRDPNITWTTEDVRVLEDKEIELENLQRALGAL